MWSERRFRLSVTLNLPALASLVAGCVGSVLILVAAWQLDQTELRLALVGFVLLFLGSVTFVEARLEKAVSLLSEREHEAYQVGRLRGL